MRLPEKIRKPLKTALVETFGETPVFLFGSRADDTKKGGDIDLAVCTDMERIEFRSKKIKFIAKTMRHDWEINIDLVQFSDNTDPLLKNEIRSTGVLFD